jgi:plastocyanin
VNDEHTDKQDVLDQATSALRDEPVSRVSNELIARTQARVRETLNAARDAASPFRHPLLRIAAAFVLAACVLAAYLALRGPGKQTTVAHDGRVGAPGAEVRDPAQAQAPLVAANPSGAVVAGRVRFVGEAPKPRELSMAANAACAAHHRGQLIDESVLVNADGTLRNVVVWVSGGLEGKRFEPPREPAVLDQQGCVYTPHVVTVMAGQRLLVKNSDPFLHNVRAAAKQNPSFNFGQPTVDGGRPLTFLEPERLYVKCDVHPWMNAHVHVLDNPFFAVTGRDGSFSLPAGLPPGTYTVSAWHEVYGEQKQQVTVEPDKPLQLSFTFKSTDRPSGEATASAASHENHPCCQREAATAVASSL